MKFRTTFAIPPVQPSIAHGKPVLFAGSCFSAAISDRMAAAGFAAPSNSHGIIYNPISLADAIADLVSVKRYTIGDLQLHDRKWFSFRHHGSFSAHDPQIALDQINHSIAQHAAALRNASWLFITFGSAWTYLLENGDAVANCHKLPASNFNKILLEPSIIIDKWAEILDGLKKTFPDIRICFTISPVKHLRDGLVANNLGKSVLRVAIHGIMERFPEIHYFPAYEIVSDELRDYRFYDPDMAHPSSQAVDYIWERFEATFFAPDTVAIAAEVQAYHRLAAHRILHPGAAAEQHEKKITELRHRLAAAYPDIIIQKSKT